MPLVTGRGQGRGDVASTAMWSGLRLQRTFDVTEWVGGACAVPAHHRPSAASSHQDNGPRPDHEQRPCHTVGRRGGGAWGPVRSAFGLAHPHFDPRLAEHDLIIRFESEAARAAGHREAATAANHARPLGAVVVDDARTTG